MRIKDQDKIKTKKDVLGLIKAYIYYRGGMGNRIDAFDIEDLLEGKKRRLYKDIKKNWEEVA